MSARGILTAGWLLSLAVGEVVHLETRRGLRRAAERVVLTALDASIACARRLGLEEPERVDAIVRRHQEEMLALHAENRALKQQVARALGLAMGRPS